MKRIIVSGLLTLALSAVAPQQKASAWCRFNIGCGINLSYESTGSTWNWCFSHTSNPPPCGYGCCYPGCYAPGYGYGYNCGYGCADPSYYSAYAGYGYNAAPATQTAPAAPSAAATSATRQVGYYFYNQGYTPSYWYGY